MWYHPEFVKAVGVAYERLRSLRKTAQLLNVSLSSVKRWKAMSWTRIARPGRTRMTAPVVSFLKGLVEQDPFLTHTQMACRVHDIFGFRPSRQLVGCTLKSRCRVSRVRARKNVPITRQHAHDQQVIAFKRILDQHAGRPLIAVDEVGFHDHMHPLLGYVQRGQRLRVAPLKGGWDKATVVMAVDASGVVGYDACKGALDGHGFIGFLRSLQLPPCSVVLMDNASIHPKDVVRSTLREKGADVLWTPCYCPDANPIENVFSVLKHAYRTHTRMHDPVGHRIEEALAALLVAPSDLFAACFARMQRVMADRAARSSRTRSTDKGRARGVDT